MKISDLNAKICEQDEPDRPAMLDPKELLAKRLRFKRKASSEKEWALRERNKGKYDRSRTYAHMLHEIEREKKDADGDPIYIEVDVTISGSYVKGSRGTYYEPGYPEGFEDITMDWAEPVEANPEGGPLTMNEKIDLDVWFDESRTQDYAQEALLDTL